MNDLRTAAQQALEALDAFSWEQVDAARIALRAALAQPVPKPVAHNPDPYHLSRILHELAGSASMCWEHVDCAGTFQSTQAAEFVAAAIAEIRQRMNDATPQQPAPEPVAQPYCYVYEYDGVFGLHREFYPREYNGRKPDRTVPLFAAPPQRKPLTEEEIEHIGMTHQSLRQVVRAVKQAHEIKE
jgi:hypothetical protein